MPDIADILAQAKALHRTGQLAEAAALYRQALAIDAEHAEANYLHGAACHSLGRVDEAIISLGQAARLCPQHAEVQHHLGVVLAQVGILDDAIACIERAVALRPESLEIAGNLRMIRAAKEALQGDLALARGDLPAAAAAFHRAIELNPGFGESYSSLGAVLEKQGDLAEAADCCRRAIAIKPELAVAHYNLGAVLERQGLLDEAAASYRQTLSLAPELAEAHNNLGALLQKQGRYDESAPYCRKAVELAPAMAEAHNNLGVVFARQQANEQAAQHFRRAVELKPTFADAYNNLGATFLKLEQHDEAVACFRRAVEADPLSADAHNNLGSLLKDQGKLADAAVHCRRAVTLKPEFAEAHANLAAVLARQACTEEAEQEYRRALALKPDLAQVHNDFGVFLSQRGHVDEAAACWQRALELRPDFADVHHNSGVSIMHQGLTVEALACFREALRVQPDLVQAHSSSLLTMQYQPGITLGELDVAHREFDVRHGAPLRSSWQPHANSRDPERLLRLGFVSSDFGFHPVGRFLVQVLENLAQRPVETVCYCIRARNDAMADRLRAAAGKWLDVQALSDSRLAERIRADQIDILFDLSGHTDGHRLLTFARKPAPIQITWMGYVGTTGLAAMDYLLADRFQITTAGEASIQERVLRLPDDYVCFDPPSDAPPVGPLPALAHGHVTFGSFNNPAKIGPAVIDVWADILSRAPGSRLLLQFAGLQIPAVAQRFVEMFASRDIDTSRLELLGVAAHADFLRQYERVDIGLDPFPYSGGLTTCEALWMGVPVVTCPGETFASRHAYSHLSNVGLPEMIAGDFAKYVELAVGLAADVPRLADLRGRLRSQMAASPLCDGPRFADNLLQTLRGVWRRWCETQSP